MSLKKIGLALIAVLALSAVVAQVASAANFETSGGIWKKNGSSIGTTKEPVTCEIDPGTVGVLTTTVGTSGTPLKLQATGTSCPEGKVFNEAGEAKFSGKIKFTGVTVVEPAGCSVVGGAVETVALAGSVGMKKGSSTIDTVEFKPASGTQFAEVEISGCSIANAYPVKGVVYGQPTNVTCTEAATQTVDFSEAIQNDAGGALTFGTKPAQISGELSAKLTNGGNFSVCNV